MNYVLHSMGMAFNGKTFAEQSLGGSESAAYYHARELARRGHRVIVFTNSPEEGVWDGVMYCHSGAVTNDAPLGDKFAQYACTTPHDVLIIQRHPLAFHKDYASKVNVLQLHDLALHRTAGAVQAGASRIDVVTAVSEFHAKQVREVYGLRDDIVRVVPNGVDLSLYDGELEHAPFDGLDWIRQCDGLRFLYQSRPERGLEHLVRPGGIMDRLAKADSRAQLFVCGYDYTTPEMAAYYDRLTAWGRALPNVNFMGALTKAQLAAAQRACDALVYPTEFEEVSCITAMEAMAASLPMFTSYVGALPETCNNTGTTLIPLLDGKADEDGFVQALLAFEQSPQTHATLRTVQRNSARTRGWDDAVDELEEEVRQVFARRSASPARMLRHLAEHSDVSALGEYLEAYENAGTFTSDIAVATQREVAEMYTFKDSLAATVAHYEKWEGLNCDRMAERKLDPEAERAGLLHTTRYRGIEVLLRDAVAAAPAGERPHVVEFGCAHGHITCLLAEQFPDVEFVGVDFMERSIRLATETAEKRGLKNVTFRQGSLDSLELAAYDAVVAPEVVEHIWDFDGALRQLLAAVREGGSLITTTPTGRWEWTGRDWWPKGREHLHHFEREDLVDLFGTFDQTLLFAPGGSDAGHGPLGSWVMRAGKRQGAELGAINYARKLRETAPRDTVSLCMIVKDAEETILSALRSACGWVDEVVIVVDDTTTDQTYARVAQAEEEFPHLAWKVLHGASPVVTGFDVARNRTVDASCGDWVLWLDADEVLVDGHNIWRVLRHGAWNAYAIDQHHMSRKPAGLVSTDHPCRLFRRDSGARFYGIVHEHPETEPGKAVPHSFPLKDVSIIHHGYIDEPTRRGRYSRNFPLLLKDLEANPGRTLNKFLYLRDVTQGIAFEGERSGSVSPGMVEQAKKAVSLYEELLDLPNLRMALDALPYYSTASLTLGGSFHAKLRVETLRDDVKMKGAVDAEGHFHSRALYTKLLNRIAQETTTNYDAKYI